MNKKQITLLVLINLGADDLTKLCLLQKKKKKPLIPFDLLNTIKLQTLYDRDSPSLTNVAKTN